MPIRYGHPSDSRLRLGRWLLASAARSPRGASAALALLFASLVALAGCAAPGSPRAPTELVPETVTDLRIHQVGMRVVLHFTLPREATDGKSLAGPPRVEIYREFQPAALPAMAEAPSPVTAAVVSGTPAYTLSPSQLAPHLVGDTVTWTDNLTAGEFQTHLGQQIRYRVRTAAGSGPWSAPSEAASITLAMPPEPVRNLTAKSIGGAIELHWLAPPPGPSPSPETFLIYRTELSPGAVVAAPEAAGATTGTSYRDTSVEPGRSYRYTVRGVARVSGEEVESADSQAVVAHVLAVPPSPPQGLTAIPVRAPGGSLEVDLSWEIASEANLAGYNVYRSEKPGERGTRLNRQLLAAPAFRDTTVTPSRTYWYSVTAVDLAGSESRASAPVTVNVPGAASQPQ